MKYKYEIIYEFPVGIRKRPAFLSDNKTNDHYADYSSHILIFPQILGKISVHEFAVSYTDHLIFFSSGLEHRLVTSSMLMSV